MDSLLMLLTTPTATTICSDENGLGKILSFVGLLVQILRWGIPVILIILGTIDVGKAVIEQDEKKQKAAYSTFIKRLIAAVIVFFVPVIVTLVLNAFADPTTDFAECTNKILPGIIKATE